MTNKNGTLKPSKSSNSQNPKKIKVLLINEIMSALKPTVCIIQGSTIKPVLFIFSVFIVFIVELSSAG